ncbi:hypothetical protein [Luteolibacter marinus]|uniref:hypothetical protein n=1 Tax=Luteolibacter marinus TaxID=2776705 RepID=UPI001868867B|nr:hypothetical protein [Luteolibacter marinus]
MKALVLHAVALFCAFVPLHQAEAAPKPPPVFGGWSPGKTFTYTVTSVISSGSVGTQIINPAPIPKGVPVYTVGQQVTFTIGKKGELIAPGMKIAFQGDGGSANIYLNKPKKGAQPFAANVFKNFTTGEPTSVALSFFTFKLKKRVPNVNTVYYTLN